MFYIYFQYYYLIITQNDLFYKWNDAILWDSPSWYLFALDRLKAKSSLLNIEYSLKLAKETGPLLILLLLDVLRRSHYSPKLKIRELSIETWISQWFLFHELFRCCIHLSPWKLVNLKPCHCNNHRTHCTEHSHLTNQLYSETSNEISTSYLAQWTTFLSRM